MIRYYFRKIRSLYYSLKNKNKLRRMKRYLSVKKNCTISNNVDITGDSVFEGKNNIGAGSLVKGSIIGFGSYCGTNCVIDKTEIGKYCCIANNVKIVGGGTSHI